MSHRIVRHRDPFVQPPTSTEYTIRVLALVGTPDLRLRDRSGVLGSSRPRVRVCVCVCLMADKCIQCNRINILIVRDSQTALICSEFHQI